MPRGRASGPNRLWSALPNQDSEIRGERLRRDVAMEQHPSALAPVDEVDRVRVQNILRAHGLGDPVFLPDPRKGGLRADQVAESRLDPVLLDEPSRARGRVAYGINADGDEGHVVRGCAHAVACRSDDLGRQWTDIEAGRVEKRDKDDLAPERRERDDLTGWAVGEREVGRDRSR